METLFQAANPFDSVPFSHVIPHAETWLQPISPFRLCPCPHKRNHAETSLQPISPFHLCPCPHKINHAETLLEPISLFHLCPCLHKKISHVEALLQPTGPSSSYLLHAEYLISKLCYISRWMAKAHIPIPVEI